MVGFKSRSVKLRSSSLHSSFWELNNFSHIVFTLRSSVKLTSPGSRYMIKAKFGELQKYFYNCSPLSSHIHTTMQYDFFSSSHQQLESLSPTLESGLALWLALTNRKWQKWHWKFWARISRHISYFYKTFASLIIAMWTNSCWPTEEWATIGVETSHPSWAILDGLAPNQHES